MKLMLLSAKARLDFLHHSSHEVSMENGGGGQLTSLSAERLASECNHSKDES